MYQTEEEDHEEGEEQVNEADEGQGKDVHEDWQEQQEQ